MTRSPTFEREAHLGAVRVIDTRREHDVPERKVLLLGEDNPQSSLPEHALFDYPEGCAGHRLREKILGLTSDRYLSIWRTNLCCPAWDAKAARARAEELSMSEVPWTTIVLLGAKVAATFAKVFAPKLEGDVDPFRPFWSWRWKPLEITIATLPHPSGRARAWNAVGAHAMARDLMRAAVPSIPWGEA